MTEMLNGTMSENRRREKVTDTFRHIVCLDMNIDYFVLGGCYVLYFPV